MSGSLDRAAFAVLTLVSFAALGAETEGVPAQFESYVATDVIRTDNFNRSPNDPIAETVISPSLGARFIRESEISSIDFDSAVIEQTYANHNARNQTLPRVNFDALYAVVPDRLEIFAIDRLGQIAADALGSLDPVDRENINYAAFGPRTVMPLNANSDVEFAALVGRSDFQHSDIGANRLAGQAAYKFKLSELRSLSLNIEDSVTKFREIDGRPELKNVGEFLRFESSARSLALGLDVGVAHIDNSISSKTSATYALSLAMNAGRRTQLTLEASQGFRDTVSDFLLSNTLTGLDQFNADRNVITAADFGLDRTVNLGINYAGTRTAIVVSAGYSKQSYVTDTALDRRVLNGNIGVSYDLGVRSSLYVGDTYYKQNNALGVTINRLNSVTGRFDFRMTERISLSLTAQKYYLNTDTGASNEGRIGLSLRYALTETAIEGKAIGRVMRSKLPDDLLDVGMRREVRP